MASIAQFFNQPNEKPLIALVGLSGIGKSQMAKEYAHQAQMQYPVLWWFDAGHDMTQQFIDFAHAWNKSHQNAPELLIPENSISPQGVVKAVRKVLDNTPTPWLLIFDNSKGMAELNNFIPEVSSPKQHHVIVTSKLIQNWPQKVTIQPLQRHESIEFIQKSLPNLGQEDSTNLAQTLGDFPLALAQAVTYIKQIPSMNVENYLNLLQQRSPTIKHLESKLKLEADDYQRTLSATLTLTFEELKKESPISYELLKHLAFLNNKGISEILINKWFELNNHPQELLHEITYYLTTFAVFEKSENNDHTATGRKSTQKSQEYEMHEQIQNVMRSSLSRETSEKILSELTQLLLSFVSGETSALEETLNTYPAIYEHSKVLSQLQQSYNYEDPASLELKIDVAHASRFYRHDFDYAQQLAQSINDLLDAGISVSPFSRARHLNTFGNIIVHENLEEGIRLTRSALKILEGMESKQAKAELFIASVNNLGDYYLIQGNISQAIAACERARSTVKQLDNRAYDTIFHSFIALGHMYKGQYPKALENIELAIKSRNLGGLSKQTYFFVEVNLLEILVRSGQYDEALALSQRLEKEALEIFQSPINHLPIRIKVLVGYLNAKHNQIEQATNTLNLSLQQYEKLSGKPDGDPVQAFAHLVLGTIHKSQKEFETALSEYKYAEAIFDKLSEIKEFDDISDIYTKLALLGIKMNRQDLTHEYLRKHIKHFGLEHPRTAQILKELDHQGLEIPL